MDAASRQRVPHYVPSEDAYIPLRTGGSAPPARLVIASNRISRPGQTQAGGLASAMLALLSRRRGTWMGWSGQLSTSKDVDVQTEEPESLSGFDVR